MYFHAFNFHTSQAIQKYFNNEIFTIYGSKMVYQNYPFVNVPYNSKLAYHRRARYEMEFTQAKVRDQGCHELVLEEKRLRDYHFLRFLYTACSGIPNCLNGCLGAQLIDRYSGVDHEYGS